MGKGRPRWTAAALAVASGLGGLRVDGKDVTIAEDGTLVVEGERLFAIGSYWHPRDEATLRRLRNAGFNLIRAAAETESLDRAGRAGFLAWVPLGRALDVAEGNARDEDRLRAAVRAVGDHPAAVLWEAPDEALWNVWYGRMRRFAAIRAETRERARTAGGDDARRAERLGRLDEADAAAARGAFARAERILDDVRRALGLAALRGEERLTAAPEAAEALLARLERGVAQLRSLDGHGRPVWMNHAPRNTIADLAAFSRPFDIVGCDIYPVPEEPSAGHSDLANRGLSSVGDYAVRMRRAARGKPVWMVLQGFGWRDLPGREEEDPRAGRRPTEAELRFMAWDAIACGARGILFWGMRYAREPGDFHEALFRVVREIAGVAGILAAPDEALEIAAGPTWGSLDREPIGILRRRGEVTLLALVNPCRDPLLVTARGIAGAEGAPARALDGRVVGRIAGGAIRIAMAALSVEVLRIAGASE